MLLLSRGFVDQVVVAVELVSLVQRRGKDGLVENLARIILKLGVVVL